MSLQAMTTDNTSYGLTLERWYRIITDDMKKETPEACMNERAARLSCLRMSKIAKSYLVDNSQYYFGSFAISQLGRDLLTFFGLTFSLNIMKAKSLEECEIVAAADGHSRDVYEDLISPYGILLLAVFNFKLLRQLSVCKKAEVDALLHYSLSETLDLVKQDSMYE